MANGLFEKASRLQVSFLHKGICGVEDLWDLETEILDKIYQSLYEEQQKNKGVSLLSTRSKADDVLETKIAVVKYIVEVKEREKTEKTAAAVRKTQKEKYLRLAEEADDNALKGKTAEELREMANLLE